MARLIEISPPLSPRLAVWPGDLPLRLDTVESEGGGRTSSLHGTLHAGAHADAPIHVLPGGQGVDEGGLEAYLGACEVIEVHLPPGACIRPGDLPGPIRAPRVLFRTGSNPDPEGFREDFVALTSELIVHLASRGCLLVGIDTPSVDPFASKDLPAHRAIFASGMRSLEGLDLGGAEPGLYTLIALPLRIEGADASPVRAVLLKDAPGHGGGWDNPLPCAPSSPS